MRRIGVLAACLVLAVVVPIDDARAAVAVVVVEGRGRGHGVGMAQDGAYWMGEQGASTDQILGQFFPDTRKGSTTGIARVVVLISADNRAVLDFPQGGEVRSPRSGPQRPGFPVQIGRGGAATITFDGGYRVEPGAGTAAAAQGGPAQPVQLPNTSSTTSSSTTSTSTTSTTGLLPVAPPTTTATTTPPQATTSTTTGPGAPPPSPPPSGVTSPEPVWAGPVAAGGTVSVPARGFTYRGEVEASAARGPLRLVNELDLEQYLWGLGEVSAAWSPASLGAQMIAARTYALRAMSANGEICDTQRCQVYKGASGEFRSQIDAVTATAGQFLSYGSTRYASTVFSANGAGVTATPAEGFGTSDASHPYLTAAPYETSSDLRWEVRVGLADVARRLGYAGKATSVEVATTGKSGRPLTIELDGDRGRQSFTALGAARLMGLQSTFWTIRVEAADAAPPPPVAGAMIQTAPDEVGAVIAEETNAVIRQPARDDTRASAPATSRSRPIAPQNDEGHGAVPWLLVLFVLLAGAAGFVIVARAEREPRPPVGG